MSTIDPSVVTRRFRRVATPQVWLVALFIFLLGYRLTLIDAGHFFWGDEARYLSASKMVDDVAKGDLRSALGRPFEAGPISVRPGFVIVSAVPVLLQCTVGPGLGLERDTLESYNLVSVYNVLVTLGITWCVYVLIRRWTRSPCYGLLGAAVYSLLVSSNVWIRHAVPYDESLLLFLVALLVMTGSATTAVREIGRAIVGGLLTTFAFTCYPGHYAFVAINAIVLVSVARRRLAALLGFGAAALGLLVAFELLSRLAGTSYVESMHGAAPTMGYFGEGYVLPWRYLRDVEGPAGVTLFVLFCGFAVFMLWRPRVDLPRAARVALAAAIGGCLFHAAMGVHFEKTVFYGRVFLMFIPFVVAGAVVALVHIRPRSIRRIGVGLLTVASLWSFVTFAWQYARITYPADFLHQTMADIGREVAYRPHMLWGLTDGDPNDTIEALDPQFAMVMDTMPEGMDEYTLVTPHQQARDCGKRFIGVNFKWLFNVREADRRFDPSEGYKLVAEATHPTAFPATGFEAYKPWARQRLLSRRYQMRIYERIDYHKGVALTVNP